jgi:uncharacterized protein YggU (UPF0235/DUF167 family)
MDGRKYNLHDGKNGSALAIRITPRAAKDEIVEILGDGTVKVHLTSGSSDQYINELLLKFLAKQLNISLASMEIVAGARGRDKLISILDMEADDLYKKVLGLIRKT